MIFISMVDRPNGRTDNDNDENTEKCAIVRMANDKFELNILGITNLIVGFYDYWIFGLCKKTIKKYLCRARRQRKTERDLNERMWKKANWLHLATSMCTKATSISTFDKII